MMEGRIGSLEDWDRRISPVHPNSSVRAVSGELQPEEAAAPQTAQIRRSPNAARVRLVNQIHRDWADRSISQCCQRWSLLIGWSRWVASAQLSG